MPGVLIYLESIIQPLARDPDDLFAGSEKPCPLLIHQRIFAVNKEITQLLKMTHPQGLKIISLLPSPYYQGERHLVAVDAGNGRIPGYIITGSINPSQLKLQGVLHLLLVCFNIITLPAFPGQGSNNQPLAVAYQLMGLGISFLIYTSLPWLWTRRAFFSSMAIR